MSRRGFLRQLPDDAPLTNANVAEWIEPFTKWPASVPETALLMDLLLRIGAFPRAKELLKQSLNLDAESHARLRAATLEAFRAAVPDTRPDALSHQRRTRLKHLSSLLVLLERTDRSDHNNSNHNNSGADNSGADSSGTATIAPQPLTWDELSGWIRRIPDEETVAALIELLGIGLERETLPEPLPQVRTPPPAAALGLLRELCGADIPFLPRCSSKGSFQARRWCLWWYAKYGAAADVAEMFRLAFTEPLDATGLIKVSSYVFPDRRQSPLAEGQSTDLLLSMGRRLKECGLGTAPRKDIAAAWRTAMWSFLPRSGRATQLRVIEALPGLDDAFSAHLVQCLSPSRGPELWAALQRIATDPGLGARTRRNVAEIPDLHKRRFSEGGWPALFEDLDAVRTR
ncbi:hypothetical protein [Streptomyces sp. NBC_01429]|uniref:hypothetical protein n=1 Tax=Streptomyces sp. NBC_01429 TaxID=2903862 RepID=UPI002E2CFC54|nr:hypothetical protein [Streptomyces sp. NBC_01429]